MTVYVCLNPVRLKSVRGLSLKEKTAPLKRHVWGSYAEYAWGRQGKPWPSVSCATTWGALGGRTPRDGRRQFRRHVAGWLEEDRFRHGKDPDGTRDDGNPLRDIGLQTYLGDGQFRDFIQGLLGEGDALSDAIVGAAAWRPHPALTLVLDAGCKILGVDRARLDRRTRGDERKTLLLYLVQRLSHCGLRELGTAFGVTPAAVSQRLQAFRDALDRDARLSRQVAQHETALSSYLKP